MEKEVYEAVEAGDYERVERLLLTGYDVNARGVRNSSPLHLTVSKGETRIARLLIEHGAEIDAEDDNKCTPLHRCAECGRSEIAGMLLQEGASVNSKNRDGSTPLHLCVVYNTHEVANLLLEFQADVEAEKQSSLFRALHFCADHGSFDTMTVLRYYRADLNARDKDGSTPLHISIRSGNLNVAKALVDARANVNLKDKDSATPLHLCIESRKTLIVAPLIEAGADKGARNKNGLTPLHLCVIHGDLDTARVLLISGAEVDVLSNHGWSPLHLCAKHHDERMATLLLARNASTETQTVKEWTPLHLCAKYKAVEVAEVLLRKGASTRALTHDGKTPLHLCAHYGAVRLAEVLLEHSADLNAKDKKLKTPLHISSEGGTGQIAKALISRGAVIDACDVDRNTPLHLSSQKGHVLVVQVLLDAGADYMCRNRKNEGPLLLAIEKRKHDVVFELLNKGGSEIANETYSRGQGPLHIAAAIGPYTICRSLIDAGARLDLKDEEGKIPQDYVRDPDGPVMELFLPEPSDGPRPQAPHSFLVWTALGHSAAPPHHDPDPKTLLTSKPTKLPDDAKLSEEQCATSNEEVDQYHCPKVESTAESESDDPVSPSSSSSELEEWTADNPFGTRLGMLRTLQSLRPGYVLADNYLISSSAVAGRPHVRLAQNRFNKRETVIIKFYCDEDVYNNVQSLHSAVHDSDHICRMVEHLKTERTGFPPSLVFEKGGTTLREWLMTEERSPVDKKWCLRQVLHGLYDAHSHGFVHGDIKPSNIVWFGDEARWKLIDWDGARKEGTKAIFGMTPPYSAPETTVVYYNDEVLLPARPSLDIWSVGMIAYELLTGERFFSSDASLEDIVTLICDGVVERKLEQMHDATEREALSNFLAVAPEKRWTVASALQHELFSPDDMTTTEIERQAGSGSRSSNLSPGRSSFRRLCLARMRRCLTPWKRK